MVCAKQVRQAQAEKREPHHQHFRRLPEDDDRALAESVSQGTGVGREQEERGDETGGDDCHDRLVVDRLDVRIAHEHVDRIEDRHDVDRLVVERRSELRKEQPDERARREGFGQLLFHGKT